MSGTDAKREAVAYPDGPAMILVEPQMGENIGAAARAMWNFGLERMRVVDPRDGWPNPKAVAMASGAGRVLDGARICATTEEAVADLHYVYATTARSREMTKTIMTPAHAMADAARRIAAGEKVGVLFGRERTGLENDDVVRANAIISVPVNPAFASLNLGQCVLLTAYEWKRVMDETPGESYAMGKTELASSADVERMLVHLEAELNDASYFWPEERRASMEANVRNIFRRAPLTEQDIRTLRGVIRALAERRRRR
jgi:tRNA/rRNA methyltransferase